MTKRIQFDADEAFVRDLARAKKLLGAATVAETIRRSVRAVMLLRGERGARVHVL